MSELGRVEGRSVRIEVHDSDGDWNTLDAIMREAMALNVDVIVAGCTPELVRDHGVFGEPRLVLDGRGFFK